MEPSYSFIDTHTHIYETDFSEDVDEVVRRAKEAGASKLFLPPTDMASSAKAVEMAEKYQKFCYPMIGLHPEDVRDGYGQEIRVMEEMLGKPNPFIAIGEVGLDFYWDKSKADLQIAAFERQIDLAVQYRMPLMIHARNAHTVLVELMQRYKDKHLTGVFHCFTGTVDEAKDLLQFDGFMLGIGGVVTFKKSILPETLKTVPLNRLVVETDSPYMAPVPMRGKRNEPAYIPYIIDKLAEIYGRTPQEVAMITTENALMTFPKAV